jgi:glutathione S-transferase
VSEAPLELFLPPRAWGIPSPSPFCAKLETWLRMAEVPYVAKVGNPLRAPRGKLPYARYRGGDLADSQVIVETLGREGYDLDGWLTPADRARGHLLRRMLEEGTYFLGLHDRWLLDDQYRHVHPVFFGPLGPTGHVVGWFVRRRVRAQAHAQGVARYTAEERARMAIADLDAVVAQLGASPFLFGDRPCTADATLFGFTCQWLWTPFDGPLQRHARAQSALVAWAERVRDRYWTKVPPLT